MLLQADKAKPATIRKASRNATADAGDGREGIRRMCLNVRR
jgi:hypothetical protein